MPVRSLLIILLFEAAESAIACCMATWFHWPPFDRKRSARRSISGAGSSDGAPQTWHLKPCSAKDSEKLMPDLALRRDSVTSFASLPMEDTIPRPVTTTRLMIKLLVVGPAVRPPQIAWTDPPSGPSRRIWVRRPP
jgi:hypothetical protein